MNILAHLAVGCLEGHVVAQQGTQPQTRLGGEIGLSGDPVGGDPSSKIQLQPGQDGPVVFNEYGALRRGKRLVADFLADVDVVFGIFSATSNSNG